MLRVLVGRFHSLFLYHLESCHGDEDHAKMVFVEGPDVSSVALEELLDLHYFVNFLSYSLDLLE